MEIQPTESFCHCCQIEMYFVLSLKTAYTVLRNLTTEKHRNFIFIANATKLHTQSTVLVELLNLKIRFLLQNSRSFGNYLRNWLTISECNSLEATSYPGSACKYLMGLSGFCYLVSEIEMCWLNNLILLKLIVLTGFSIRPYE